MQINAKGGTVKIRLDQAEGRRMRDAAYIATRIAANLPDSERATKLKQAAEEILTAANDWCPSQDKLDRQDAEPPQPETKFEPPKSAQ